VTLSQESCTRNLSTCTRNLTASCFLILVFYCTRILHQMEQSSVWCKKLADTWPKLRDVIGRLVCRLWRFVVCIVCRCFFMICKFLVQETLCKFLVQDSSLCVTSISQIHIVSTSNYSKEQLQYDLFSYCRVGCKLLTPSISRFGIVH